MTPGPPGPPGGVAFYVGTACIGHGEQSVFIANPKIHATSAIMLTTVGSSVGNTFSILNQTEGSMVISGKPDACFKYIILNPNAN